MRRAEKSVSRWRQCMSRNSEVCVEDCACAVNLFLQHCRVRESVRRAGHQLVFVNLKHLSPVLFTDSRSIQVHSWRHRGRPCVLGCIMIYEVVCVCKWVQVLPKPYPGAKLSQSYSARFTGFAVIALSSINLNIFWNRGIGITHAENNSVQTAAMSVENIITTSWYAVIARWLPC